MSTAHRINARCARSAADRVRRSTESARRPVHVSTGGSSKPEARSGLQLRDPGSQQLARFTLSQNRAQGPRLFFLVATRAQNGPGTDCGPCTHRTRDTPALAASLRSWTGQRARRACELRRRLLVDGFVLAHATCASAQRHEHASRQTGWPGLTAAACDTHAQPHTSQQSAYQRASRSGRMRPTILCACAPSIVSPCAPAALRAAM